MATLRRALCLAVLLPALLCAAPAAGTDSGSVPAGFWQDGLLYVFARLPEGAGGAEPRLQLGSAGLTLSAEGPLVQVAGGGTPVSYLLLVDRSNSMGGLDWNVRSFAKRLIRSEAVFSLATFGAGFRLEDTGGGSGGELLAALDAVSYDEEGTDLPTALVAAMDHLAAQPRAPGELVNLVVITDGVTEAVEDGEALEMARYRVEEDASILVHTVGLATSREVSGEALEALASLGTGVHAVVGSGGVSADAAARSVAGTVEGLWTTSFPVTAPEDHFFADASLCLFERDAATPALRLPLPDPPLLAERGTELPPEASTPSPSAPPPASDGADPAPAPEEPSPSQVPASPAANADPDAGAAAPEAAGGAVRLDRVWIGVIIAAAVAAALLLLLRRRGRAGGPPPPGAIRLRLEVLEGRCACRDGALVLAGELTIGRDRHCGLVWRERDLPPVAGRIVLRDGLIFLEELDPRCGTLLGGMRLYGPSRLRSGDEITMGPVRFILRF